MKLTCCNADLLASQKIRKIKNAALFAACINDIKVSYKILFIFGTVLPSNFQLFDLVMKLVQRVILACNHSICIIDPIIFHSLFRLFLFYWLRCLAVVNISKFHVTGSILYWTVRTFYVMYIAILFCAVLLCCLAPLLLITGLEFLKVSL